LHSRERYAGTALNNKERDYINWKQPRIPAVGSEQNNGHRYNKQVNNILSESGQTKDLNKKEASLKAVTSSS